MFFCFNGITGVFIGGCATASIYTAKVHISSSDYQSQGNQLHNFQQLYSIHQIFGDSAFYCTNSSILGIKTNKEVLVVILSK